MKKIELRKVPCGETFTAFGDEFVVLDHIDGGVLSIRKDIWKSAPFDKDANNNLREASITVELAGYMALLRQNGATDDAFVPMHIDLKATDGTRAYGYYNIDIGLLTLEQYGKYKDIIPLVDDWWWLATPWSTRWLRSPSTVSSANAWLVHSNGCCDNDYCSSSWGVRPILNFTSCLLVSLPGGSEEDAEEAEKMKKWEAYQTYICDWMEENVSPVSSYGNSPLGFDEWLLDLYAPNEEQ